MPAAAPLRLSLRQLQIFVAIARAGSTMAAAERIALSQSATSAALNELEALLGGKLFTRVGRRLVLNEHGRSMLPRARALLDAARGIESDFGESGRAAAHLRIAASTTIGNYVLPGVIAAYRRRHGDAHIAVQIENTEHVARAVAEFEVDLGFVEGPTHEPNLRVEPWMTDELLVVCSPKHPIARLRARSRRRVTIAELQQADWLLREAGSGTREVMASALLPHLHRLRTDIEFGSAEAIKQAAAEGLGLTCLSRHAVEDLLKLGRLVELRTELPPLERRLYLLRHERRYESPALAAFVRHCLKR
jgi:DNA-binding transcriptional LysR family regulator